jgi:type IV secretion system protein VirD4
MTIEKETVNYSGQRTDLYLKHIFRSVEQVQRPLITVDEIRRMKPPRKATNDPNSRIVEPGDMLIFINGVAPIYGTQSLFFLSKTLLARTKIPPPRFTTAAQRPATTNDASKPSFDAAAIAKESMEEAIHGQRNQL